jgi:hypothetical protein
MITSIEIERQRVFPEKRAKRCFGGFKEDVKEAVGESGIHHLPCCANRVWASPGSLSAAL